MSLKITSMAWRARQGLDGTSKLVLLRLADRASDDGGRIYPAVPKVAEQCCIGERTVQLALRRLQDAGVLVLVREADFARRLAREYRIDLRVLEALADLNEAHQEEDGAGAGFAPVQDLRRCRKRREPVRDLHQSGAAAAPQQSYQQSRERSGENQSVTEASKVDEMFEEWWREVPRKIAKGAAQRAYRAALKKATPAELIIGIQRYAAEVAGREAKFVKHPSTWLNGQCWLDEPTGRLQGVTTHHPHGSFIDAASRVLTDTPEARAFKGALKL